MNVVGIDVSKGNSMVAIMRPLGEVVTPPFKVNHTTRELEDLTTLLQKLVGETKVVLEYTGKYYRPIARYLSTKNVFVSAVHAKLIHDYGNNSIRRVKTDKADAVKIANYGLDNWHNLNKYIPEDETRFILKNYNRQYCHYIKIRTSLKNNLLALLDETFPSVNLFFTSTMRPDGHQKWIDFAKRFWHCDTISKYTLNKFTTVYNSWCIRNGYYRNDQKAKEIYDFATKQFTVLPCSTLTKALIVSAVNQLEEISSTVAFLLSNMQELAKSLPEYDVVINMNGVGKTLAPQLVAEIGDVRRFKSKGALIAFAGIDSAPFQSGKFEAKSRKISKRGSPNLRRTLFLVMSSLLRKSNLNEPVFAFIDRKRAEGKHYYVYMTAGGNKFLRIYYARVKEYLNSLEN